MTFSPQVISSHPLICELELPDSVLIPGRPSLPSLPEHREHNQPVSGLDGGYTWLPLPSAVSLGSSDHHAI